MENTKKTYLNAKIEISLIQSSDVIATSDMGNVDGDGWDLTEETT